LWLLGSASAPRCRTQGFAPARHCHPHKPPPAPGPLPFADSEGIFFNHSFLPGCHPLRVCASFDTMHHASITERVGHYVVTPLTHTTASGKVSAAVSIRRGVYDRVFRFIDQFDSRASATRYALQEGRSMVLCNQLS